MFLLAIGALICASVRGEDAHNSTASATINATVTAPIPNPGETSRTYNSLYADLVGCAFQSDTACFVDVAERFIDVKRNELLAQADQEVMRATGRADPDNSPSVLSKTIEKLIADLSGLFKDGLRNFFSSKEDDEDPSEGEKGLEEINKDNKGSESRDVGEQRKKKKKKHKNKFGMAKEKKKMKHFMKLVTVVLLILAKFSVLYKIFNAHMQIKFFIIAVSAILMQFVKFWLGLKNGYNPPRSSNFDRHGYQGYSNPQWVKENLDESGT